jgi:hypothetical protein
MFHDCIRGILIWESMTYNYNMHISIANILNTNAESKSNNTMKTTQ